MNDLFKNMPSYETILVIMAIPLFLILIFLLIWCVIKKRTITTLLPFFLLPIIMVAYPAIKSVKVGNIVIDNTSQVEKLTGIVSNNPGDTVAVAKLKNAVVQLKNTKGVEQSGNALLAIANAQIAIGRYDSASLYLNKAEKVAPGMERIDSSRRVLVRRIKLK
ncbi:MAG: hypothetical protein EPN39_06140 [Chitinophagaceae bacterium]|nr:MAG: hypothetical protein EPN39_06140 [Chitinophagaceae bacterium]